MQYPHTYISDTELSILTLQVSQFLLAKSAKISTAESCTGGLVAATLTELEGASSWFDRGFVTYSNEAKNEMLGVPMATIESHGAVSIETVAAMAQGAIQKSQAQFSFSISGVAGPTGGSEEKPVGTVCFAWCVNGQTHTSTQLFEGDRHHIRRQSVAFTLRKLLAFLQE